MYWDPASIAPDALLFFAILLVLLVFVSIADIRYGIIPDWTNAAIAVTGLAKVAVNTVSSVPAAMLAAVFSFFLFAFLRHLFAHLRGYPGIGMGDVKFIAAASVWTGYVGLPSMILVASVSGLAFFILRNLAGYRTSQTFPLPFGPHLAAGLTVVCLFGSMN